MTNNQPLTDVGSIFQQQTIAEIDNVERNIRSFIFHYFHCFLNKLEIRSTLS